MKIEKKKKKDMQENEFLIKYDNKNYIIDLYIYIFIIRKKKKIK